MLHQNFGGHGNGGAFDDFSIVAIEHGSVSCLGPGGGRCRTHILPVLCVRPFHSGVLVDGLDVLAVVLETSTRGHGIGAGPTGACRLVGCGPAARRVLISQISNLPPCTCAVASSYVPGPTQGIEKWQTTKHIPFTSASPYEPGSEDGPGFAHESSAPQMHETTSAGQPPTSALLSLLDIVIVGG